MAGLTCVTSSCTAIGYNNMPEETKAKFTEDGFRTSTKNEVPLPGDKSSSRGNNIYGILGNHEGSQQVIEGKLIFGMHQLSG